MWQFIAFDKHGGHTSFPLPLYCSVSPRIVVVLNCVFILASWYTVLNDSLNQRDTGNSQRMTTQTAGPAVSLALSYSSLTVSCVALFKAIVVSSLLKHSGTSGGHVHRHSAYSSV